MTKRGVDRRTVLIGAGAAATSLAAGATPARAADAVKVGVLFPLTGPLQDSERHVNLLLQIGTSAITGRGCPADVFASQRQVLMSRF